MSARQYNTRMLCGALISIASLTACMPSEFAHVNATTEKVAAWVPECARNYSDLALKVRYCDLIIRSDVATDNQYMEALFQRAYAYGQWDQHDKAVADLTLALKLSPDVDFYHNRAISYKQLGQFERAAEDWREANRLTGERKYLEYVADMREAREESDFRDYEEAQARRTFALRYEGMWCGAVQKDSILYPANEIQIQTLVYGAQGQTARDLPSRGRAFNNVNAGYRSSASRQDIWQGPGTSLIGLSVVMWEYDDGGSYVDLGVKLASTAAQMYAARGSGVPSKYGNGAIPVTSLVEDPVTSAVTGAVESAVSDVLKSVLGTNNDHVGTHHWTNISPAQYAGTPTRSENGFAYHISTNHRAGGANCRTYYSFRETTR